MSEEFTMASGGGEYSGAPLHELSNQFLICPLCLEQYKSPKVLPCQHTFCLDCLQSYVFVRDLKNTLPCPLCKEAVRIPGNDVSNFKNNFMIVSLLQFVEKTAKADVVFACTADPEGSSEDSCGACGETSSMCSFCESCKLWLCSTCTKAHSRLPATSCHQILTNEQVDARCKAMVGNGEKMLTEIQTSNDELYETLVTQQGQLPENVRLVKERVEAATARAMCVIKEKSRDLFQQADQFFQEQTDKLSQRGRDILSTKKELDEIEELLKTVRLSNDGFKNQKAMNKVECFLGKANKSPELGAALSLAFSAFGNNLTELENLEMGQMQVVSCESKPLFLSDRALNIHKIASLVERVYISALAITKFADKFVVANNQTVMVFKPDSRVPRPFLSPLSQKELTKPWGIAYSEEERKIFVSQAGRHEGDGSVVAYTHDGHFHSNIASGLTLPRGVAAYHSIIFVCDQIDKCVYVFQSSGKLLRVIKKTPDGKFLFNGPMFVSVGKNRTIAVSDNCSSVKVFDKDFQLKYTYVSSLRESQFWDVHVMQSGVIVVCDWKHGLHKISPDFSENGLVSMCNGG